jgi:hypothetical protein
MAIDEDKAVQDLEYAMLHEELIRQEQILE